MQAKLGHVRIRGENRDGGPQGLNNELIRGRLASPSTSKLEDSHEDGNFLRWSSYGPEYGVVWSF